MKKHSAMTFYKSIPGIIIDPDMEEEDEELVEEPVVEESGWDLTMTKKKKKWSPFFPKDEEPVVEEPIVEEPVVEEPVVEESNGLIPFLPKDEELVKPVKTVVEEPVVDTFAITLETFKKEKATILRRFTNSLKQASTKQTIAAVLELQSSFNTIANKFAEASLTELAELSECESEPCDEDLLEKLMKNSIKLEFKPVEPVGGVVVKKLYKLKYKEGVTAAMVDKEFLDKFEGLKVEEPKKKKIVKKKIDGASTSHT
jgi:hypothetical protein